MRQREVLGRQIALVDLWLPDDGSQFGIARFESRDCCARSAAGVGREAAASISASSARCVVAPERPELRRKAINAQIEDLRKVAACHSRAWQAVAEAARFTYLCDGQRSDQQCLTHPTSC